MVSPKVDHYFLQLTLAVNSPQDTRHLQFAREELRRTQIVLFEVLHHSLAILRIVHRVRIVVSRSGGLGSVVTFGHLRSLHLPGLLGRRSAGLVRVRSGRGISATLHTIVTRGSEIRRQGATLLKLS